MATPSSHVAEMQGLYGPFTIAERVVQKIWLRGDFDRTRLRLTDGRSLEIRTPGEWNLLGGPDFRGARLLLEGVLLTGDVEVHFHAVDWRAHQHQADRAYDNVVLHVVLFPPGSGEPSAVHGDGREIPTLILLPRLHRDLEEYASDDALETLTARDRWERFAGLTSIPPAGRRQLLWQKAGDRWRQKVRFAKMRIERVGWTAAAHGTALEILGYRHNRAAMLTVAAKYPLAAWTGGLKPQEAYEEGGALWQLQGVRPANHPRTRLQQYQQWVAMRPDWPERLRMMGPSLPAGGLVGTPTKLARAELGLPRWRKVLALELLGGAVGGTRLDNLACDGFLPLAAAGTGTDLEAVWFHWFLGDVPEQVKKALPNLGIAGRGAEPYCHGWAQGLIGWILDREARASC